MVHHHIHDLTTGELAEGLGQGRSVLGGAAGQGIDERLTTQDLRGPTRCHCPVVVDQADFDGVRADHAGGHEAVGAPGAADLGGVEPLHDCCQGRVVRVVLYLHEADDISIQAHKSCCELVQLAFQF